MGRPIAWLLAMATAAFWSAPQPTRAENSAYAFTLSSIEGDAMPLAAYAGRPVLVVNTASMCGFTYQYTALQRLWSTYRDRGLVVLGVPSNDFGGQEPGSAAEIKTFCEVNFDVDFPMSEKVQVKGEGAHPLFVWLREELGPSAGPRWNFHKYLIGTDGHALRSWPSWVEPDSAEIRAAVESVLPAS